MENNIIHIVTIVNLLNFFLYGIDKFKAKFNFFRISEKTLLMFSIIGGFGGIIGMKIFKHKTRKKKFYLANSIGIIISTYLVIKY